MPITIKEIVPAGTVIDISIRVPGQNAGKPDGLRWTNRSPQSLKAAREEIKRDLLREFFNEFLPAD
jgi:hypothetical protein